MRVGDTDFERAVDPTTEELRRRAREAVRAEDCRITYKQLSEFLAQHGLDVPYHSDLMSQLLAEASRRDDAEGRGMISALVATVNSGTPTVPGAGFHSFARRERRPGAVTSGA